MKRLLAIAVLLCSGFSVSPLSFAKTTSDASGTLNIVDIASMRQFSETYKRKARLLRMQAGKRLGQARASKQKASDVRTQAAFSTARLKAIAANDLLEAENVLNRARERRAALTDVGTRVGAYMGNQKAGLGGALLGAMVGGAIANSAVGSGASMDAEAAVSSSMTKDAEARTVAMQADSQAKPLEEKAGISEQEAETLIERANILESLADAYEFLANSEELRLSLPKRAERLRKAVANAKAVLR